jgi:hypothetical protein
MSAPPIRLCCVAALLLLVGCAHQLQFRVVDAASGNALPGATVKIRRVTSFTYFHREPNEREVGSTDANGLITVPGITAKDDVHFKAPDHFGAVAALTENNKVKINSPISAPMTPWVSPQQTVTNSNGLIVIPLKPQSSKQ